MVLDGTELAEKISKRLLFFDVNNGISRRCWAENEVILFFNY